MGLAFISMAFLIYSFLGKFGTTFLIVFFSILARILEGTGL